MSLSNLAGRLFNAALRTNANPFAVLQSPYLVPLIINGPHSLLFIDPSSARIAASHLNKKFVDGYSGGYFANTPCVDISCISSLLSDNNYEALRSQIEFEVSFRTEHMQSVHKLFESGTLILANNPREAIKLLDMVELSPQPHLSSAKDMCGLQSYLMAICLLMQDKDGSAYFLKAKQYFSSASAPLQFKLNADGPLLGDVTFTFNDMVDFAMEDKSASASLTNS